jgi:hypothetical protein
MSEFVQPHDQLVQKHSLGLSTQGQVTHLLTLYSDVSGLSPIYDPL